MDDKKIFRRQVAVVAVGIGLYVLLANLPGVIGVLVKFAGLARPLIIGGCIAFVLSIPMNAIEKLLTKWQSKGKKKKVLTKFNVVVSSVLTALLAISVLYFVFGIVFPQIVESFINIYNLVMDKYPEWLAALEEQGMETERIKEWVMNIDFQKIFDTLKENLGNILQTTVSTVSSTASMLFAIFTGLIFGIYILSNRKKLALQAKKMVFAFLKKERAERIIYIASLSHKTFSKFISGQCMEAIILGTLFFVVMMILRMPYALVISVLIALTAIIPYVGAFIGLAIGVFLIAIVSPVQALIFIIVFLVLQQLEGQLIYPRVVGNSVGLPAVWTLAGALMGGALFGIVGMVAFIPLVSVLYTLLRENMYDRLKKKRALESLKAEEEDLDRKTQK